jgi:hypothetical protein
VFLFRSHEVIVGRDGRTERTMESKVFARLVSRVERGLTADQHLALRAQLDRIESARVCEIAIEARARDVARSGVCPRCGTGAPRNTGATGWGASAFAAAGRREAAGGRSTR